MKKQLLLAAISSALILGSCTGKQKEAATAQDQKPIIKTEKVTIQPVEQIQEYTGTVEAKVKNNIAPSSPVRIEKIYVEVGDNVRRGQKLVQMDASSLKKLKLQVENQKIEFKRVDELYKVGGASKAEWDNAKMALDVNETSYKNLEENTQLLSPIDGVVTARNYDNGDMYSGGQAVLTVEQIHPVKLLVNISESYFPLVKLGDAAKIKVDVYGDEEFEGKVSLIYPTINESTRTFSVELSMTNANSKLRPGMFARATMNYGTANHVVVPDVAVIKQVGSGDRYVYVYKDGKVTFNKVELGRRMDNKYELISGIENNADVVVAGQTRLSNGCEVTLEK